MGVGQHDVRVGKSIPVPVWTRLQAVESILVKNGIVCRAGKSIIQILFRRHQMTDILQLSSCVVSHLLQVALLSQNQ